MNHLVRGAALAVAALAVSLILTVVAVPSASARAEDAGGCTTAADVGSKVWKKSGPMVKAALNSAGGFGATAAQVAGFVEKGIKLWNEIAGDTTWAKIGPRRLDYDQWDTGTIIGSTERLFVTSFPATNPVTVDIHKLDNDGEVKFVVCKVPEQGKAVEIKTFTVDKDTDVGLVKSIDVPGARGHVITIALHGKSVAKSLQYKVRAKMSYQ
jgi:hypothetical protein